MHRCLAVFPLPCYLCGDATVASPLPHLCWSGAIVPLPLPCQRNCCICTTAATIHLSPCHHCLRTSIALGASFLAIFTNADTNVIILYALSLDDADTNPDSIIVCPSPCTLVYEDPGTTVTCPSPQQHLFALPLSFVDAVVIANYIISIHILVVCRFYYLKPWGVVDSTL